VSAHQRGVGVQMGPGQAGGEDGGDYKGFPSECVKVGLANARRRRVTEMSFCIATDGPP